MSGRPRPEAVSRLGQKTGLKKAPLRSPMEDAGLPQPTPAPPQGPPATGPGATSDATSEAGRHGQGSTERPTGGRPPQFREGSKKPVQIMLLPSTVAEARKVAEYLRRSGHPEITFPVFVEAALRGLIDQVSEAAGDPEDWDGVHPTPRAFEHLLRLPEKNKA